MSQLLDRYFGNGFRTAEFCKAVAGTFTLFLGLGHLLLLSTHETLIISYTAAVCGAVLYIRNPKDRDWQTEATTETISTTEGPSDAISAGS